MAWAFNHDSDSDDEVWRERHYHRKKDADTHAHFGVIRPLDIMEPEDAYPRAALPRAVVQNLLADPCNHIMTYDADFIEDIVSSALIYGMPLFFNSWNCGWRKEEGVATLVRAPPRRLPSNKDCTQIGFFGCFGYEWQKVGQHWLPHPYAHFNGPTCLKKATAECDGCKVLRCPSHIHTGLEGITKDFVTFATAQATSPSIR